MFYGIYGDSDGDDPEVIGEASWLMARTCFPNDDLNGNAGHGSADVTCKSGITGYVRRVQKLTVKRHSIYGSRRCAPEQRPQ